MTLCVCGHPSEDHRQFDAGEVCLSIGWPMTCLCDRYRKAADSGESHESTAGLSAGVTPEGLAGETVAETVNSESPYGEEGMTEGFND